MLLVWDFHILAHPNKSVLESGDVSCVFKRFGFSLEEIRQLLDLYNMDDSQETQLRETFVLAQKHLTDMQDQRAELDEAIAELKAQMDWGAARLAKLEHIPAIAS